MSQSEMQSLRRRIKDLRLSTTVFIRRNTARMSGTEYEKKAAKAGRKILRERLQLLKVEVAFQPGGPGQKDMDDLTSTARELGMITQGEKAELLGTGLIYVGMGYSRTVETARFITAEVETTITPIHVERARSRRKILQKATTFTSIAAVIGTEITPEAKAILGQDVMPVGMDAHGRPNMILDANGRPNIRSSMDNQNA